MALEESRFFDYADDNREYQADDFAEFFRTFLTDGVPVMGTNLAVTAPGTGMFVNVNFGAAVVQGYGYWLRDDESGLKAMAIVEPHQSLSRIDRVVLRLDKSVAGRSINLLVKNGEASGNPVAPVLTREGNIYELSLAKIRIEPGVQSIAVDKVIDERTDNSVCGLIEPISVRNHIDQGVKTSDSPTFNEVTANKVIGAVYQ